MQCTTTGKKYVGQTMQADMSNYCGSGIHWKKHCKKYGGWNRTNIIVLDQKWLSDIEKANEWLSSLHNQYWLSDDYANSVSETTDTCAWAGQSQEWHRIAGKKGSDLQKDKNLAWYNSEHQREQGKKGGKSAAETHKKNGTLFFSHEFQVRQASKGGKAGKGLVFWYNTITHEAVRRKEQPAEGWVRGRGSDSVRREAGTVKYKPKEIS